jgi:hypothetical protein
LFRQAKRPGALVGYSDFMPPWIRRTYLVSRVIVFIFGRLVEMSLHEVS